MARGIAAMGPLLPCNRVAHRSVLGPSSFVMEDHLDWQAYVPASSEPTSTCSGSDKSGDPMTPRERATDLQAPPSSQPDLLGLLHNMTEGGAAPLSPLAAHPEQLQPGSVAIPGPATTPSRGSEARESLQTPLDEDPFEGSWDDDLANLLQDVVTEENPAMTAEKYSADTVSNAYQDDDDDDLGDEDDDQDNDDGLRRSTRRRQPAPRSETPETEDLAQKSKRKVGRPIKYRGDPNAAHLSLRERRVIKRRIANRESAQRVRQRKQDILKCITAQLRQAKANEQEMQVHVDAMDKQHAELRGRLNETQARLQAVEASREDLQRENAALRRLVVSLGEGLENAPEHAEVTDDTTFLSL